MPIAKAIVLTLVLALFSATTTVMGAGGSHEPTTERGAVHCDACPDALNDGVATPHAGNCANGAGCVMNAVTVSQQPVIFIQTMTPWVSIPKDAPFVSTEPRFDLPPPRA